MLARSLLPANCHQSLILLQSDMDLKEEVGSRHLDQEGVKQEEAEVPGAEDNKVEHRKVPQDFDTSQDGQIQFGLILDLKFYSLFSSYGEILMRSIKVEHDAQGLREQWNFLTYKEVSGAPILNPRCVEGLDIF